MEFLKEPLGEVLYAQVQECLQGAHVKIGDLSGGQYVGRAKFDALQGALTQAEARAEEADRWKAQAEALTQERAERVRELAAEQAASSVRFSSRLARQAFVQHVKTLPLTESGTFEGLDAFLAAQRRDDPEAFGLPPAGAASYLGTAPALPLASREHVNNALRGALRRN